MPQHAELGAKTFGMNDQALFATWSGDHNPLHVSEIEARRLVSGLPVVHGAHTVLEALARWAAAAAPAPCARMKAEFTRAVNVGDTVHFSAAVDATQTTLTAQVDGQVHMTLQLFQGVASARPDPLPAAPVLALGIAPLDQPPQAWLGRTHGLPSVNGELPAAELVAGWLGPAAAHGLGQLSTMVGMACPGLHSIFASFDLNLGTASGAQRFRAQRHEPRFKLIDVEVDGPWWGAVRAFVRPAPQPQPGMHALMQRVDDGAYAGLHAWVLGGSRGLGELTSKLMAAGGCAVTLTYANGREDALRVAAEIQEAGRGPATVAHYVAGQTSHADMQAWRWPDAVFYFATPRIGRRRGDVFDPALRDEFMRCYVDEPAALALALEERARTQGATKVVRFLNPSSVFVDELPLGMAEYALAKAAAEVLARDLNKRLRHVQMVSPRLPRMLTDQTSGLMASQAADAVEVMQPLVAELLHRP